MSSEYTFPVNAESKREYLTIVNVNVIAFITRHKVNLVDTEAWMVCLGGHPAKY